MSDHSQNAKPSLLNPPHSPVSKSTYPVVQLTGERGCLSRDDVVHVARHGAQVTLGDMVPALLSAARNVVDAAQHDGEPHYGINTGFGSLSRKRIPQEDLRALQRNLIRSHAAGVGEYLPVEIVRGMMLLLANSLSRGHSGVRSQVVELLVQLLNARITPRVPSVGSVGASGDLAPLAALGLALIGEGECTLPDGRALPSAKAFATASGVTPPLPPHPPLGPITPITLEAKEGLAIINGTHFMASLGAFTTHDAQRSLRAALVACAMSIDACRGTDRFLHPAVHQIRNQPGQISVAAALRTLLVGSSIIPSHREDDPRVQDPYSLRCAPQVLGAVVDALEYINGCIDRELSAVTDNPLVFPSIASSGDDPIISAGNFHGMPLAIPLDSLAISLTHIAGISERRVFWMISAFDSESHLKPYLANNPGLNSGLMIAQYTAAACCNEMISLCTSASVSNISTSAGIEDYNSFGPRAGMKAARAQMLLERVIAIELLSAAEGIEYHRPLRSGNAVEAVHALVRTKVPRLLEDRPLTPDIETIAGMIRDGDIDRAIAPHISSG